MDPHLSRALLLIEQNRPEMAQQELHQVLAADPQNAYAHALLASCLNEQKKYKEATAEAQQAVHLAPDFPFAHYVHACTLVSRNHYKEALAAVQEAIRLDPDDPDFCALESGIHHDEKRWEQALASAERGLALAPEHVSCNNLRAMALVKLGRRAEAGQTMERTLAKNPESSSTHANQGWACLEAGQPEKALHHFQEALRLDAGNDWARQGIVEALKARNFVYAVMLKYFFFMSRLSGGAQWAIILGGYFGNRILGSMARENPQLAPWIWPVRILYLLFVFLTWTAQPLANLLLRLNRFGRMALSPEQVTASNWVGACVGLALACLGMALLAGKGSPFWLAALLFGGLVIPVAGTFDCQPGWPRKAMAAYSLLLFLVGGSAITSAVLGMKGADAGLLLVLFVVGLIASPWVANLLMMQRPKH